MRRLQDWQSRVLDQYFRPQIPNVALLLVLIVATAALQLAGPIMLRALLDGATTSGWPLSRLRFNAALLIVLTIASPLCLVLATRVCEDISCRLANGLRGDLLRHLLTLDFSFYTKTSTGEIIERLDGDLSNVSNFLSRFVLQAATGLLLVIGILAILLRESAWVGAVMGAFVLITFCLLLLVRARAAAAWQAEGDARSRLLSFVEERLEGLDDIRANGAGHHVVDRLDRLSDGLTATGVAAGLRSAQINMAVTGPFLLAPVMGLMFGLHLYSVGRASIGTIYLFMQFAIMLASPVLRIGGQLQGFQQAMASLTRVGRLFAARPEVKDGAGILWAHHAPSVEFREVGFAYPGGGEVLRQVSFRIPGGSVLGVLGRTGAGKTTLLRLLARLHDPSQGAILVDGQDIRDARLTQLRRRIGMVSQSVELFRATVRENVTLFDANVSDDRILEVLGDVGMMPWLRRLPLGLDTVLEGASGLSSGEAQLLALTRIFLNDPDLVVLDEPTSRLDPMTDRLIEQAIDKLLKSAGDPSRRRTAVVVAHKLSTLSRVDWIVIFDGGVLVEFGPREELSADLNSRYARLLRQSSSDLLA